MRTLGVTDIALAVSEERLVLVARGAWPAVVEAVRNSIDADATEISVDIDTVPRQEVPAAGGEVPVRVVTRDNGHGMRPEQMDLLFGRWGDS